VPNPDLSSCSRER